MATCFCNWSIASQIFSPWQVTSQRLTWTMCSGVTTSFVTTKPASHVCGQRHWVRHVCHRPAIQLRSCLVRVLRDQLVLASALWPFLSRDFHLKVSSDSICSHTLWPHKTSWQFLQQANVTVFWFLAAQRWRLISLSLRFWFIEPW